MTGQITSISINNLCWQAFVSISGLTTGGSYSMGFGPNFDIRNPYNPKLIFNVLSSGFDDNGNQITVNRIIYGTTGIRKPYPNEVYKEETLNNNIVTLNLGLSEYIYSGDQVTANILENFYNDGVNFNNSVINFPVINNSSLDYPKVIGGWSWPPIYSMITGESFDLRAIAFQKFGQSGRPVRSVRFTVNDEFGNSLTGFQNDLKINPSNNKIKVLEYIQSFSSNTLITGSNITGNFIAYPWIGNSNSVLDTSQGPRPPSPLPSPIVLLNNKSGFYRGSIAVIDSINGDNNSGQVVNATGFSWNSPPNSYLTINSGVAAIRQFNNANFGRNDVGNSFIYLRSGNYAWLGGGGTFGNTPKTYITISSFSGLNTGDIRITGTIGSTDISDVVKIEGVSLRNSGSSFHLNGINTLWIDRCIINANGQATFGSSSGIYITNSQIINLTQGLRHFGSTNTSFTLIRDNYISAIEQSTINKFIGNDCYINKMQLVSQITLQNNPICNSILAFNSFQKIGKQAGSAYLIFSNRGIDITGAAIIQNLFENTGENTANTFDVSSSSDSSGIFRHMIAWNNSMPGCKNNWGYNDSEEYPLYRVDWSEKNNLFDDYNIKTDTFLASPNGVRTGNWSLVFGVGSAGNVFNETSGIGAASNFVKEFPGINCISRKEGEFGPTGYINYILNVAANGGRIGTGLGPYQIGDYRLNSTSPVLGLPVDHLLPYDLYGNSRYLGDCPGCFTYQQVLIDTLKFLFPNNKIFIFNNRILKV